MLNRILCLVSCLAWATPAVGELMSLNQRLDHALYPKYEFTRVFAGRIRAIDANVTSRPSTTPVFHNGHATTDLRALFDVRSEILCPKPLDSKTIDFPIASFYWPNELVARKPGTFCIFVLREDNHGTERYQVTSIVPARERDYPAAGNAEAAQAILAGELLAEIQAETDLLRRRSMLRQLGPILPARSASDLLGFLDDPDVWSRRAALAGIVYATGQEKYLRMAEQDIRQFIRSTDVSAPVDGFEPGFRYDAYFLLVSRYFFLENGWSREEALRDTRVLPIYRLIARETDRSEFRRWENGVRQLCRCGNLEDAQLLYDYLTSDRKGDRARILDNTSYRQNLIMGLSRILNLELPNWVGSQFPFKEPEQFEAVRAVLVARGLIPGSAATQPDSK